MNVAHLWHGAWIAGQARNDSVGRPIQICLLKDR
jgi:hypothetical protein